MNLIYKSNKLIQTSKNIYNILPKYSFSTLDLKTLDFSKYFNVVMEKDRNEEIQFEFPNLTDPSARPIIIQTEDIDIGSLIDGIIEKIDYISGLTAYSLEQVQLSNQTQLSDLEGDNFYLIDKNKKIFLIQNQDKYQIDSYQNISEYCEKIELSFLERKVISNYLRRFDELNLQTNGQTIFSDQGQQQKNIEFDKKQIITNLIASLPNHKNIQTENEQALFQEYAELQQNIEYMKSQKKMLEGIVHTSEKRKMALGLLALIGNFAFVGVGTYSIWSWDIVEPMAYFLQFSGTAYLSFHFFKFQKDYDNDEYLQYRKNKALVKVAQQNNFDLKKLEELEIQFAELEKKIKANVLIHL